MAMLVRKSLFVALGAFILVSPVFPQVFKVGQPWIRQWTMYSGVGTGLMKGDFLVQYETGETKSIKPLEMLGLERYPNTFHYEFDRRVWSVQDIERMARSYCDGHQGVVSLSYSGRVGVPEGWANLKTENLCQAEDHLDV